MICFPAIDLIDGACIRLTQGAYDQKTHYSSDPVAVAQQFEQNGATHLHVVDLDGAKKGQPAQLALIQSICEATQLQVDVGGGIQSLDYAQQVLDLGAQQVNIGSLALRNPDAFVEILQTLGPERCILSVDSLNGYVAGNAWKDQSTVQWQELIARFVPYGLQYVTATDIQKDGMLTGPSFSLYDKMRAAFPELKLIASGGVSNPQDLFRLQNEGLYGAVVGKAFYEKRIPASIFNQLKEQSSC